MTMPPNNFSSTNDKIKDAANQTANEVKDKTNEAKSGLHNVADFVEKAACKAGKSANDMAKSVSDKVCTTSDSFTGEIRRNPVQSAFIALAIGIIGTLFYRRSA